MPMRACRLLLSVLLVLAVSGCASSSLFMPYPERAKGYRLALSTGDTAKTLQELDKRRNSNDKLLFLLESGRLQALSGDTDASLHDFDDAIAAFRAIDDRALVSLGFSAAQGSALLSNDNAIPYQGEDYERIFLHQYQALNYVAKGDLSGALVEVRRANQEQELARDRHQKLVDKAEDEAKKKEVKVDTNNYDSYFAPLDNAANRVKNSFQNAYTFYTSAVLYEAAGKPDDAYVDYKRALEITPDNRYLLQDTLRVARKLGRRSDIDALAKRATPEPAAKAGDGSVVVLYEEGFVPAKKAVNIPIPWPQAWYMIAFPIYDTPWQAGAPLRINAGGMSLETDTIADVQALASRALKDKLLPILTRQVLRAYTKHEMAKQMQQKNGELLGFLTTAYNLISEQADLRSWLTLPHSAQIARFTLPEGEHSLKVNSPLAGSTVTVPVQRGRITLLRITDAGGRLYTSSQVL